MPDDPRLGMFLKQWEEDVAEGKTVRSLHDRLDRHVTDDERSMKSVRDELQQIRVERAYDAGRQGSGGEFGAGGTGRFNALPPNGHVPTPSPFQPLVAVNVEPPERKRRTSLPPAIAKALSSTTAKVVFLVLAAAGGWILRHVGVAPPTEPPAHVEGGK